MMPAALLIYIGFIQHGPIPIIALHICTYWVPEWTPEFSLESCVRVQKQWKILCPQRSVWNFTRGDSDEAQMHAPTKNL